MYKPLKFFTLIGGILFFIGFVIGTKFTIYYILDSGYGHIQSLILASTLMIIGFQTIILGLLSDLISANRKILEDVQFRVRKNDYNNK